MEAFMPEAVYEGDGQTERFGDAHAAGGFGVVHISIDKTHIAKLFPEEKLRERLKTARERQTYLDKLRQSLKKVITYYNPVKQHPYWSRLFAWPDRIIVRFDGRPILGVRAPFSPLHDLERSIDWAGHGYNDLRPEERGWWIARVAIGLKLARALHFLQQHTLVHNDLSPRNVFGDVYSGEMTLIDCDGIVSHGTELLRTALGTDGYIAPELLMGDDLLRKRGLKREANFNTDDHALAVLLYQLLLYRHPMKGPKRHPDAGAVEQDVEDRWLFAEGATYIEDPVDTSNRPRKRLVSAATLGSTIEGMFQRAFVNGLRLGQPGKRPTAAEWEDALTRLYDRIVPCANPACPQRFFAAPERPGAAFVCPLCNEELRGPATVPYLRLRRFDRGQYLDDANYVVVGWPGRVLHEWHLATHVKPVPDNSYVYDPAPVARFEYDQVEDVWVLRNLRMSKLLLSDKTHYVPIGGTIALEPGMMMWLSGDSNSRLAEVQMAAMKQADAIYALPEVMVVNNEPWPTIQTTSQDKAWEPGEPISLKRYEYHNTVIDPYELPLQPIPPKAGGYIARVPVYMLALGLLAGVLAFFLMGTLAGAALGVAIGVAIGLLLGIPITRVQWRNDLAAWRTDNADYLQQPSAIT
jgi:serine/threonine protein kinase